MKVLISWQRIAAAGVIGSIGLTIALTVGVTPSVAQSASISWSTPIDLSNTPQGSAHPAIVTDNFGNVHVFWSEDADGSPLQPGTTQYFGNAIFHKRWDGNKWNIATDVLYVPSDVLAHSPVVTVDPNNYLHVVWTGQSSIYYSNAPAWQADSAQAWSAPIVIATISARSMWESGIAADSKGQLHLIYATGGNDPGIYYVRSTDGGATWDVPAKISKPFDQNEHSFSRLRIVTDSADRLHATWQTQQLEGFGQAIYYARSVDGGQNWSTPQQLGYRNADDFDVGWVYVTSLGQSELRMIYNAGPNSQGRYYRISRDGGATWTDPQHILTEMEGINGYNVPLVDKAGHMHLIVNMRRLDQTFGMFYSQLQPSGWTPVTLIAMSGLNVGSAHYTAAAVRLGNEIHVVWEDLHSGEIDYMRGVVQDVPAAPAQPTPTALTDANALQSPTPPPTALPMAALMPIPLDNTVGKNMADTNSIVPGTIAALGLVIAVVVLIRVRKQIN